MTNEEIPDGVPSEEEFNPEVNPHAVPANHKGAMHIEIGLDRRNGLIVLRIGSGEEMMGTAIPIAGALQLCHNILGKCNEALMGPPPALGDGDDPNESGQGGSGLILPGQF